MRLKAYILILIMGLIFIVSGLFYTQIIKYEKYRILSEENRLRVLPLKAPRGNIFDHNGKPLAKDILSFNASVVYSQIKDKEKLVRSLAVILDQDEGTIRASLKKTRSRAYSLMSVKEDIGTKAAIQIEEILMDHPGLFVEVVTKRIYPEKENAAHIIGYLGLINRAEFSRLKHYGYRINDLMGRSGLEKQYDNYLRGDYGGKQIEVDHLGREVSVIGYLEPRPGKDIVTTIDTDLQEYCFGLLKERKGAIVAIVPGTGAIRALVSSPSYDPSVFIDRKDSREIRRILRDKDLPMMNRAISGVYPPGSVFKTVTATAALERGKSTLHSEIMCEGSIKLGKSVFRCWKKKGHGIQTITDAIKNSCNVYFYRTGLALGVDNIVEFARKLGIGSLTGIDLPGESAGLLPTPKWKKKRFKKPWYPGETVNYSIGQGYLLTTPLQVARFISVFANNGYLVQPYIVEKVGGVKAQLADRKFLNISDYTLEIVREGMRRCVNDPRGSGMKARQPDLIIAGKTGTSQTSIKGKNHGWFAGFAPFANPKLVVVVFDEYGGMGGYFSAETAGKVLTKAKELGLYSRPES